MTKLNKVLKFIRQDGVAESKKNYIFTWKQYCTKLKCTYSCTETNYLSMLVKAGYVIKVKRGTYHVAVLPGFGMSYEQLRQEAYGSRRYVSMKGPFGSTEDFIRGDFK